MPPVTRLERPFGPFVQCLGQGIIPNKLTFPFLLKSCSMVPVLKEGRQAHVDVVKLVLDCDLCYVRLVFDKMEERNVWTWNAMILGLAQHGSAKSKSLLTFTSTN
ncbi:hypothetical protein M0R45_026552 [Rubus argutus]|uniref:Pentatricopeptide repeat-containing protein n=1 Tax=Rubus argutus TaxID=59490 RepID=A0AAW1WXR6_RUBAR